MTAELTLAVEKLYEVFAVYPGNPDMCVSPLKGEPAALNAPLFSKPLRELSNDDLDYFVSCLISTWGDTPDLKHFLPRILELTANLHPHDYHADFILRKMIYADFSTWESNEQEVIYEYLYALWTYILQEDSEKLDHDLFLEYFAAVSLLYPRFNDLLNEWLKAPSRAMQHLANIIYAEPVTIFKKEAIKGFYNEKANGAAFIAWLLSDEVHQRLTDVFFETPTDDPMAETISWAVKMVEIEKFNRERLGLIT